MCQSGGERCQAGEQHTAHSSSVQCHHRLPSLPLGCRCLSNLRSGQSVCSLPFSHFDHPLQGTDLLPQGGHLCLGAGCAGVGWACHVLPAAPLPAACCQAQGMLQGSGWGGAGLQNTSTTLYPHLNCSIFEQHCANTATWWLTARWLPCPACSRSLAAVAAAVMAAAVAPLSSPRMAVSSLKRRSEESLWEMLLSHSRVPGEACRWSDCAP